MRITSWNLLHGLPIPPDEDAKPEALLSAALSQLATDVIGLQEVDYFLERSGNHNQTALLQQWWVLKIGPLLHR